MIPEGAGGFSPLKESEYVRTNAPEAQCLLAPRCSGVPKKWSLFLGVVTWGKRIPQIHFGVP
jgi:hypothetical protein